MSTGINAFVELRSEGTYGTDPGSGGVVLRVVENSFERTAEQTQGNRGLGRVGVSAIKNRLKKSQSSMKFDAQYEGLERLLLHFLGAVQTSGAGADKTHVFAPSLTRQVGLFIKHGMSTSIENGPGTKLNSMNVEVSNELAQFEFAGVGLPGSTEAFVAGTGYPTAPDVCALEGANGLSTLVNSLPIDITSAQLSCSWPHTEDREFLGQENMQEPLISDVLGITGSMTREFESTTHLAQFLANTAIPIEFNYISTDTIPTTATQYELKIKLYKCLWTANQIPVSDPGPIIETLPFVAMVDDSGNFMDITLVNGTASVS